MSAAAMAWPTAVVLCVAFVSAAAMAAWLLWLVATAGTGSASVNPSNAPEWRYETTVTRGANPSPPPRTKEKPPEPPSDPKEKGQ